MSKAVPLMSEQRGDLQAIIPWLNVGQKNHKLSEL